jgi:thiol-disulfide isomerase/thioredoxin
MSGVGVSSNLRIARPAIVLFLVAACARNPHGRGFDSQSVVVELGRVADPSPDRWRGMTNIFFSTVPPGLRDSVRLGATRVNVELAEVVRGDGLATIYAARFKTPGSDDVHYVVDTDGDLDFVEEQHLAFRQQNGVAVADLEIDVRSVSGAHRTVSYQVLLGERGYTYARIAEYRAGRARVGDREYAVRLRSASRDHPFYGPDAGTVFLIDLDGDGRVAEQVSVAAQGPPSSAEEVAPGVPFLLEGRPYEVAELDSAGSRLVLRPSAVKVAAAAGFVAPEFTARLLSGSTYRLSDDRGKVVLVEFWSVDCQYSEHARPALNQLASRVPAGGFRWVALARENDGDGVRRHLESHLMNATVALHDSLGWARYNPAVATPLFYVIDGNGIVRFRALGASAVDAVSAKVDEFLDSIRIRRARR